MAKRSFMNTKISSSFGIILVIAIAITIPLTVWSLNNVSTNTRQYAAEKTPAAAFQSLTNSLNAARTTNEKGSSINITNVTSDGFNVSYSWSGISVAGYYISIRDDTTNDIHNPYVYCGSYRPNKTTNVYSGNIFIPVANMNPTYTYTIILSLAKNNGDIIASSHSVWQPQP
jgi:hypothetical protein